ncbi:GIY-YIG nuclease family protein [Piscinibacter gummiphilus]|uniref:GIY-YIG nuclease family protein n=1 Tax=Piscinibacter gummiphilus TaxID=946333 RepID=A0ABZ0CNF9_9BURK|nr:GIY-YIG nuclease family protein [Piscinibacter gummiphilus]WOB06532.1 GIY-YIG nuclease family protein [Piscinibacter gummiphilus]
MPFGFVYALSSSVMPCVYKIGFTDRSPRERARELSTSSGVPVPFDVACYFEADDSRLVEQAIHRQLAPHRINQQREFFSLHPAHLYAAMRYYAQEYGCCGLVDFDSAPEMAASLGNDPSAMKAVERWRPGEEMDKALAAAFDGFYAGPLGRRRIAQ